MARPFKIFLIVFAVLILLPLALVGAFLATFDPNEYTPQIAAEVERNTGRQLSLGKVEVSIFPVLGINLEQARLSNAPDFGSEPFAEVRSAAVGIKLLPLLTRRHLEVRKLELDGLRLNLARNKDGTSNWEDLVKAMSEEQGKDEPTSSAEVTTDIQGYDIAGLSLSDAALTLDDRQAGRIWKVSDLKLETGALRPGEPVDLSAAARVAESALALDAALELKARLRSDAAGGALKVEDLVLTADTQRNGITVAAQLDADLLLDSAAKRYQARELKLTAKASGASLPGGEHEAELNADALVDLSTGTGQIQGLRAQLDGVQLTANLELAGLNDQQPRISGPISVPTFNARELLDRLSRTPLHSADPLAFTQLGLDAQLDASDSAAALEQLALNLDGSRFSGRIAIADFARHALRFTLQTEAFDADRYLPPRSAKDAQRQGPDPERDSDAIEVPVETLQALDVVGSLEVGQLGIHGLQLSRARLSIDGPAGSAKTLLLSSQLYGGSGELRMAVNPVAQPTVSLRGRLASVQLEPLLTALNGKASLRGTGTVAFDLKGAGRTVGALKRDLDGDLSLQLLNGAVKGINVGGMMRQGQALLRGQQATDSGPSETDFTSLSISAKASDGVLRSDDLDGRSPAIRLAGSGWVNLAARTLDYTARPTLVETSRGQGGRDLADLSGLTVPLRISGSWDAPKIKLELEDAMKARAAERLRQELKDNEDQLKGRLNDALGKLLERRRRHSEPAQEPAEQPATEPQDSGT